MSDFVPVCTYDSALDRLTFIVSGRPHRHGYVTGDGLVVLVRADGGPAYAVGMYVDGFRALLPKVEAWRSTQSGDFKEPEQEALRIYYVSQFLHEEAKKTHVNIAPLERTPYFMANTIAMSDVIPREVLEAVRAAT